MVNAAQQSVPDYSRIQEATRERASRTTDAASQERTLPRREAEASSDEQKRPKRVSLVAYIGPLVLAGFKDLLDLALLGSFPGIGTVVTVCVYLAIFFLFLITDNLTVRLKPVFLFQAGGALMFGTLAEGIAFGLNFLPIGLGLIVGIYIREKKYTFMAGGSGLNLQSVVKRQVIGKYLPKRMSMR